CEHPWGTDLALYITCTQIGYVVLVAFVVGACLLAYWVPSYLRMHILNFLTLGLSPGRCYSVDLLHDVTRIVLTDLLYPDHPSGGLL
ncbi:unnamed protein product, partial [Amoebophrya sp. A25]